MEAAAVRLYFLLEHNYSLKKKEKKYVYMQIFMFLLEFRLLRSCSLTGRRRSRRRRRRTWQLRVKIEITCITLVLQDIISFQHVLHFGVGRSQIECKLKVKTEISVFP